ncbi:MAG: RlmE family RNA methyltransferase, partial [Porticoccaceae bacterium]|nr:RlmE family RNA methyltransferase [Porticoccaceae bacterium]
MAKSKNRSWIKQHVKDPYVKQSQVDGYRSRASYKLLEIVEKDRLIRSGMTVVDLGSAPGGWSQVAARLVGHTGRVHALDLLPMDSIAGVDFIQGDFTEED